MGVLERITGRPPELDTRLLRLARLLPDVPRTELEKMAKCQHGSYPPLIRNQVLCLADCEKSPALVPLDRFFRDDCCQNCCGNWSETRI